MKNKLLIGIVLIILLLVGGEIFARYILGLGQTPTYVENDKFEYIFSPNQNIRRFNNKILVNEYSMRSAPLRKDSKKILIFGDSVLNGGSLTSHEKLATTLLDNKIGIRFNEKVQVLNISAGSWGPDNAFGYLQEYGDFNTSLIILVFSSHDAHDNMMFEKIIDVEKSYPSKQPCCALWDGFNRYLIPAIRSKMSSKKKEFSKIHKIDKGKVFNSGWPNFVEYCRTHHIPFFVLLHPTQEEIIAKEYDQNGKEIIAFLKQNKIQYYLELNNTKKAYYRDSIHYNIRGQQFLYEELKNILFMNAHSRLNVLTEEIK